MFTYPRVAFGREPPRATVCPSTLKERLRADLTTAMKARDELVKATLRMTLTAIGNAEVAGTEARELSDDEVLRVIAKEAKKRAESAEAFAGAGRGGARRPGARRGRGAGALPAAASSPTTSWPRSRRRRSTRRPPSSASSPARGRWGRS